MLIIGAVAMMAAIPILVWTLLSNDGKSKVKASDLVGRGGGVINPLDVRAQVLNRSKALRLFNKNTALCKDESRRIGCDACPVLED